MKRQSLRDEILAHYGQGKGTREIARLVGCTPANVTMTIRRSISWNGTISPPLPPRVTEWIMNQAAIVDTTPAKVARQILIDHYKKETGND